ncbi:MAG: hypothetical protein ACI8PW_001184 [Methylophilaceae bacterium]
MKHSYGLGFHWRGSDFSKSRDWGWLHTFNFTLPTIIQSKVTILFITHQLPKGLQVDEAMVLGKANEPVVKRVNENKSKEMDA